MTMTMEQIPTIEDMAEEAYNFIIEGCSLEYAAHEIVRIMKSEYEFDTDEDAEAVCDEYLDRFERGWYKEMNYLRKYHPEQIKAEVC